MNQSQHPRRGSIIGPLILITIGVLFLLANFGYISGSFWLTLIQFWPLLLILAGLEILFGRTLVGQLVVLLVALLAVGGIVWLALNPNTFPLTGSVQVEKVTAASEGVQTAHLELNTGVGDLNLGALDAAASDWIDGTIAHPRAVRLEQTYQVTGGVAQLKLDTKGTFIFLGNASEKWNLRLAPNVPLTLDLNAGVGGASLDLNALNVSDLKFDTGVGETNVVLPSYAGTVNAKINGGIGGLTIWIPEGVAARIRSHAGIGGVSINPARFPRVGDDLYESSDYTTAANKIDLNVDAGIGGITIP